MKTFTKKGLTGSLKLVTIDHITSGRKWTTKQVLMLVDKDGSTLSNAQFRSNATKQAEKFLVGMGWECNQSLTK